MHTSQEFLNPRCGHTAPGKYMIAQIHLDSLDQDKDWYNAELTEYQRNQLQDGIERVFRESSEQQPTLPDRVTYGDVLAMSPSLQQHEGLWLYITEDGEERYGWDINGEQKFCSRSMFAVLSCRIANLGSDTWIEVNKDLGTAIMADTRWAILDHLTGEQPRLEEPQAQVTNPVLNEDALKTVLTEVLVELHHQQMRTHPSAHMFRQCLRLLGTLSNYKATAIAAVLECDRQTSEEIAEAFDSPGVITLLSMLAQQSDENLAQLLKNLARG